jgi:hypothetical protein
MNKSHAIARNQKLLNPPDDPNNQPALIAREMTLLHPQSFLGPAFQKLNLPSFACSFSKNFHITAVPSFGTLQVDQKGDQTHLKQAVAKGTQRSRGRVQHGTIYSSLNDSLTVAD